MTEFSLIENCSTLIILSVIDIISDASLVFIYILSTDDCPHIFPDACYEYFQTLNISGHSQMDVCGYVCNTKTPYYLHILTILSPPPSTLQKKCHISGTLNIVINNW